MIKFHNIQDAFYYTLFPYYNNYIHQKFIEMTLKSIIPEFLISFILIYCRHR